MGQTLLYWLGLEARAEREAAGISMVEIAALLGMNTTKGIERFERAENWPLSLEWTLAAYGRALAIDGRDLVSKGLARWLADGEAPTLTPMQAELEAKAAARAALEEEARALAQQRASRKARRPATKRASRRKAAGS